MMRPEPTPPVIVEVSGLDDERELTDDELAGVEGGQMGPPLWQLKNGPSPWDAT
jgi:bacteriocin-like protein